MRVLVDIVHPAHVLFFARPMRMLKEGGHIVRVLSREKDVTVDLLDEMGISHTPISHIGRGALGLARELLVRDARLLRSAMEFRPDVMVGCGGVAISHVGTVLRKRSVAFYENEIATLQLRLTLPFISEWHVPHSYFGPIAPGRTYRYNGVKELSYFHPNGFVPQRSRALAAGLDPDQDNFVIRLVSWGSAHDFGRRGIRGETLDWLVRWLKDRGKVHISAEGSVPEPVNALRFQGSGLDIHHLLAFSRLYIGESATMAGEAAVLGTPAFYVDNDTRGFIQELESAGLVEHRKSLDGLAPALIRALRRGRDHYRRLRDAYIRQRSDVAQYVFEAITREREAQA